MKLDAKSRGIKGYKSMSKERLLTAVSESELVQSKKNFNDKRLKKIREVFNDKRLKKIREDFNDKRLKKIREDFMS